MAAVGLHFQAFGHREPRCTQQLREVQLPHAEREIDHRIGVESAQRERTRKGRATHRRVDLGDLDCAPKAPPGAIESQGHIRRIAELRLVRSAIGQRSEARAARAHVHMEAQRVGAGLEIHAAVRNAAIPTFLCPGRPRPAIESSNGGGAWSDYFTANQSAVAEVASMFSWSTCSFHLLRYGVPIQIAKSTPFSRTSEGSW